MRSRLSYPKFKCNTQPLLDHLTLMYWLHVLAPKKVVLKLLQMLLLRTGLQLMKLLWASKGLQMMW